MAAKKPKTPAPTSSKADKKRGEILKAAGKCFRKTGFHLASMQEICTETELGPGAVYRYFPSKDAIIEAMADDERTQARGILTELPDDHDAREILATISRVLFDRYKNANDAGMMTEVYAEGLRNKKVGSLVRRSESAWIDTLATRLQKGQQRGQIDGTLDARHTALLLTALWDGMVIRHAYHAEDKTPALGEFFDAMLVKLLGKSDAKPEKRAKPVTIALPVISPPPQPAPDEPANADTRQMSLI
jgi:AcrR family transcriptional regulator